MPNDLSYTRLRELIAAATPGPWTMDQPVMGFSGFRHSEEPALFTAAPLQECPHGEQNHTLILELVNNAPALAGALEKADLLEWWWRQRADGMLKFIRAAKEAADAKQ